MSSFSIQLNNLRLFGNHGLHAEEKLLGAEFEVNIFMKIKASMEDKISIGETINYVEVYKSVKEIFAQPEELLETICIKTSIAIKQAFPQTKKLSIRITKLHPPITSFVGSVSVTYNKKYK